VKEQPFLILGLVAGLLIVKFVVLFVIGRITRLENSQNFTFALALAQGGEFAFVLVSFGAQMNVFDQNVGNILVATVALSMVVAPFLFTLNEKLIQPRFSSSLIQRDADEIDEKNNPVILAGFGRFGNVVGRVLNLNGFKTTVLDLDADQVELVRKLGLKVFYGDASRLELLRSAGAERAKLLIIAIDDVDKIRLMIEAVRKHFPHLRILVRAAGRDHATDLINMGLEKVYRETLGSSLDLSVDALRILGLRAYDAVRAVRFFKRHDEDSVRELAVYSAEWETDPDKYLARARKRISTLQELFEAERNGVRNQDTGWEHPEKNK
jgi:voltage-gated potassium channel Kch